MALFFCLDKLQVVARGDTNGSVLFASLPPFAFVIHNIQYFALDKTELVAILWVRFIRVQGTCFVSIVWRGCHHHGVQVLLALMIRWCHAMNSTVGCCASCTRSARDCESIDRALYRRFFIRAEIEHPKDLTGEQDHLAVITHTLCPSRITAVASQSRTYQNKGLENETGSNSTKLGERDIDGLFDTCEEKRESSSDKRQYLYRYNNRGKE